MQTENIIIREGQAADIEALDRFVEDLGSAKTVDYFDLQFEAQAAGKRVVILAEQDGVLAGYCVLNWHPKYAFFNVMEYPEIQDLNVARAYRKRGIATQIIQHCEGLAKAKGIGHMGIGVGVHSSYGPPQRLYAKLGYVPDGHGVTYDRQQVGFGEFRPVDDDLCLMMVKDLS